MKHSHHAQLIQTQDIWMAGEAGAVRAERGHTVSPKRGGHLLGSQQHPLTVKVVLTFSVLAITERKDRF